MKRNRDPSNDATEEAFGACLALLEGDSINIQSWSLQNRLKLNDMMALYLSRGQEEGACKNGAGDCKPGGGCCGTSAVMASPKPASTDAAADATAPTVDSLFTHLSTAKDLLRGLVPLTDVDTKAAAPSYEEEIKTFEIDAFLYEDDDEVEESLVEPGHVARNYCTTCGSHAEILPTRFISHSFSRHQLAYWFRFVVPRFVLPQLAQGGKKEEVKELRFLDVGSRFGIVPVAAALSLPASQGWTNIQGIEFNAKYCDLSGTLVERLGGGGTRRSAFGGAPTVTKVPADHWTNRIRFHTIDALGAEGKAMMANSDLICFNNVFEWYSETDKLLTVWKDVRQATQTKQAGGGKDKKKFIMTNPSLEESLGPLLGDSATKVAHFMKGWVKEVDLSEVGMQFTRQFFEADAEEADEEQIECLHLYEVITK